MLFGKTTRQNNISGLQCGLSGDRVQCFGDNAENDLKGNRFIGDKKYRFGKSYST